MVRISSKNARKARSRIPEKYVEIRTRKGTIRGMLHGSIGRKKPLVIIVHGYFSSNKLGPAGLYVQIARAIAERGLQVLRFDFIGFGESDGDMESVTLQSELEDGRSVISTMRSRGYSRIILVGHSFGCNLSLLLAGHSRSILKVIAISPIYEKNSEGKYLKGRQVSELKQKGVVSRKGFIVNKAFINALNCAPGFDQFNPRVPVTLIRGTMDQFYSSGETFKTIGSRFPKWTLIEIAGADHNFMAPAPRARLISTLTKELRSYV